MCGNTNIYDQRDLFGKLRIKLKNTICEVGNQLPDTRSEHSLLKQIFSNTCKWYLILEVNKIIFWVAAGFLVFS